jgi:hypothetical protein
VADAVHLPANGRDAGNHRPPRPHEPRRLGDDGTGARLMGDHWPSWCDDSARHVLAKRVLPDGDRKMTAATIRFSVSRLRAGRHWTAFWLLGTYWPLRTLTGCGASDVGGLVRRVRQGSGCGMTVVVTGRAWARRSVMAMDLLSRRVISNRGRSKKRCVGFSCLSAGGVAAAALVGEVCARQWIGAGRRTCYVLTTCQTPSS